MIWDFLYELARTVVIIFICFLAATLWWLFTQFLAV